MKRLLIKVCGMREPDNIRRVEALRPDYMGFICWTGSRRNVTGRPDYLPVACRRTGVFVDPSPTEVAERVEQLGLDATEAELHMAGDMTYRDTLTALLRQYIANVYTINPAADFGFPAAAEMKGLPFDLQVYYAKGR